MISCFSKPGVAAVHVTEAALSASDVTGRLSRAVKDAHPNDWAYYKNHVGDDESGDVIYECHDGTMSCPYDFDGENGSPVLHTDDAKQVMERVSYDDVPDDDDEYTSQEEMEESFVKTKLYNAIPLYERFISKGERDKADSGSFAGKGKSFPILKAADVMAAVRSMGRAGSANYDTATLKRNIIRIAKKKGFAGSLPKSWQGNGAKESRNAGNAGKNAGGNAGNAGGISRETGLTLVESATTIEVIHIREAKADYEIKLIAPGKGSSAFYPAEVLKRDGPKVFKANTHVYLNHPTAAEEAQRPEGDVANLAGVLTTDAVYHETHAKGPGLYARMKVFADHAQMVEEKAPHVGMSIRASGQAESEKRKDGLPVLKELVSAESVDVVTRAGAGGMILTEAARAAGEEEMDSEELKQLRESNRRLLDRELRRDAREQGLRMMESLALPPASKNRIIEAVIERGLPSKDDALDVPKFTEMVNQEARREGAYVAELTGAGRVLGMGAGEGDPAKIREAQARREADEKRLNESAVSVFSDLAGSKEAGKFAATGEAA